MEVLTQLMGFFLKLQILTRMIKLQKLIHTIKFLNFKI